MRVPVLRAATREFRTQVANSAQIGRDHRDALRRQLLREGFFVPLTVTSGRFEQYERRLGRLSLGEKRPRREKHLRLRFDLPRFNAYVARLRFAKLGAAREDRGRGELRWNHRFLVETRDGDLTRSQRAKIAHGIAGLGGVQRPIEFSGYLGLFGKRRGDALQMQ